MISTRLLKPKNDQHLVRNLFAEHGRDVSGEIESIERIKIALAGETPIRGIRLGE
jgi:hypothetical protein